MRRQSWPFDSLCDRVEYCTGSISFGRRKQELGELRCDWQQAILVCLLELGPDSQHWILTGQVDRELVVAVPPELHRFVKTQTGPPQSAERVAKRLDANGIFRQLISALLGPVLRLLNDDLVDFRQHSLEFLSGDRPPFHRR